MKELEYADRTILALRAKYQEKKLEHMPLGEEIPIGTNSIPLYRAVLFDGKCSIMLPETMTDMDKRECAIKYRDNNRPQIIKTDSCYDADMTFCLIPLPAEPTRNISVQLEKMRDDMKRVWKQNVFYDTGEVAAEETTVAWMDCKAFCLGGELYNLIFMFPLGNQAVLGNFHCSFPQYDIWKPAVVRLLSTIQTGGGEYERNTD